MLALKTAISFSSTLTLISSIKDFGEDLPLGSKFGSKVKALPEDKKIKSF